MPKIYCIKHNLNSNILYDYITHIDTYKYKMKQNETKNAKYLLLPINKYFYAEKVIMEFFLSVCYTDK